MKPPLSSLGLACPVLAAPMAGGASTPALVAAAARAGSLGFLAAGYKAPDLLRQQIAEVREQAPTFGVNLFAPNPVPVDPAEFRRYAAAVQAEAGQYGLRLDEDSPVEDDDAWAAKVDLLVRDPVPAASFTFGIPDQSVVTALKRAGTLVIQTVTSAGEARLAAEAGADVLVVQAATRPGCPSWPRAACPPRPRGRRSCTPAPTRSWSGPRCCVATRAARRPCTGRPWPTPAGARPCSPGPSPAARPGAW